MHGYGVACFTAKCRRRAAAPPARLLHTPRTLFSTLLSSSCTPSSPASSLLGITLFAFSAASRVSRRALPYSRILLLPPMRTYIDRTLAPSPRIVRCTPRCISLLFTSLFLDSLSLSLLSLSQRENPPDYIVCFLSTATSRILVLTLTLTLTLTRTRISGPL